MKNNAGFTLTELMVALSIIALMAAIGAPAVMSYLQAKGVGDASDQIYGDLNRVKHQAIKTRANATINFNPAANTYQIVMTDPATGAVINYPQVNLAGFRGGVQLGADPASGAVSLGQLAFNFRGTCPAGSSGAIYLTNAVNSSFYRVRTTLAGGISLHRWNNGTGSWQSK